MTNTIETGKNTDIPLPSQETPYEPSGLTRQELIMIKDTGRYQFPAEYMDVVFIVWYKNGRPRANKLHRLIPNEPDSKMKPSVPTLQNWINKDLWHKKADAMDFEVALKVQSDAIADKVEMVQRLAADGLWAQSFAKKWIVEHEDSFNPNSAVRLWIEGVRIERENRGLDKMIEQIANLSDESITEEVARLIRGSEVDIQKIIEDEELEDENEAE